MIRGNAEIARIAALLSRRRAVFVDAPPGGFRAAVALVLRPGDDGQVDLLMIQRAERTGDPWSGHVALPGGRFEPGDESLEATALRETLEETSVDIASSGAVLGVLDDVSPMTPHLPPVVIRPFVAAVDAGVRVVPSDEVAEAFWVPLPLLAQPTAYGEATVVLAGGEERSVPSYRVGARIVWGLTERILRTFLTEWSISDKGDA